MKLFILLLVSVVFTGCGFTGKVFNSGVNGLPSVQNCEEVTYHRKNSDIEVSAKCRVPAADAGGLGVTDILK